MRAQPSAQADDPELKLGMNQPTYVSFESAVLVMFLLPGYD